LSAPARLEQAVESSLNNLNLNRLAGLLLHKESHLNKIDHIMISYLINLKEKGAVKQIGVSVYTPARALTALNMDLFDIIQFPASLIDRRFEQAKVFDLARKKDKLIYVRSVFLQGLLLMEPENLPPKMNFARPVLEQVSQLGCKLGLSPAQMALAYVKVSHPGARVLFGAETVDQVKQNVRHWASEPPVGIKEAARLLEGVDERIINPTLWPL